MWEDFTSDVKVCNQRWKQNIQNYKPISVYTPLIQRKALLTKKICTEQEDQFYTQLCFSRHKIDKKTCL